MLTAIKKLKPGDPGISIKFMFIMLSYLEKYRTMKELENALGKSERQIYRNLKIFEEIGFQILNKENKNGFFYRIGKIKKWQL